MLRAKKGFLKKEREKVILEFKFIVYQAKYESQPETRRAKKTNRMIKVMRSCMLAELSLEFWEVPGLSKFICLCYDLPLFISLFVFLGLTFFSMITHHYSMLFYTLLLTYNHTYTFI